MSETGDAAEAPSWLDAELIQRALRHGGGVTMETAKVTATRSCPAIPPGTNYCSAIYRVHAKVVKEGSGGDAKEEDEEVTVVVKVLPLEESIQRIMLESNGIQDEGRMLADILPQMHVSAGVGGVAESVSVIGGQAPLEIAVAEAFGVCEGESVGAGAAGEGSVTLGADGDIIVA